MTQDLPGQRLFPFGRYSVEVRTSCRRGRRTRFVTAANTSNLKTAKQILDGLEDDGYTGFVKDADTGHRWNRTTGWTQTREPKK